MRFSLGLGRTLGVALLVALLVSTFRVATRRDARAPTPAAARFTTAGSAATSSSRVKTKSKKSRRRRRAARPRAAAAAVARDPAPARFDHRGKKLIESGWDEPEPWFLRGHVDQMEGSPFDGCVFRIPYARGNGNERSFTWEAWGRRPFRWEELSPALEDLKAFDSRRLTHNFPRVNVTPADLDWFDDYATVLGNLRLAARFARAAGCPGVFLDVEEYKQPLFDYRRQRDAARKSWSEYARQVRRRGREVMSAFEAEYPGLTLYLTFGYSLPWDRCREGKRSLADSPYGLLAPFLDGMVDAASDSARIVDGGEIAYGYRDTSWFAIVYRKMKYGVDPIVADPEKYHRLVSIGLGVWMDFDWKSRGWRTDRPDANYISPASLEPIVRRALEVADEYVFVYSEKPRWWSPGGRQDLPDGYDASLRRVRRSAGLR